MPGSPPRARGRRADPVEALCRERFTPARAGQTPPAGGRRLWPRVHPRSCGAFVLAFVPPLASAPRVRSTPARAGRSVGPASAVHPCPGEASPQGAGVNEPGRRGFRRPARAYRPRFPALFIRLLPGRLPGGAVFPAADAGTRRGLHGPLRLVASGCRFARSAVVLGVVVVEPRPRFPVPLVHLLPRQRRQDLGRCGAPFARPSVFGRLEAVAVPVRHLPAAR